jgi:hypothetical protein
MGDDPMMQKVMEFGTPGAAHKVLEPKVGKWTFEYKCYDAPGGTPQSSKGTAEVKWIMDGRFLEEKVTGDWMGQTFNGTGTAGYDNMKKKYVASWVDNMSTGIMTMEGTYDAGTKTFTYTGECPDFMAGKYVKSRSVEKWTDNDHMVSQAYKAGPDGKEFMFMELHYTRAK